MIEQNPWHLEESHFELVATSVGRYGAMPARGYRVLEKVLD